MYYIDLTINGQTIAAPEELLTVNGTKGIITCRFTFNSWDNFTTKTAVFKNTMSTREFDQPIINNACLVPTEALLYKGVIQIALRGESPTQVQRTEAKDIIRQIATLQGGLKAQEIPQSQYSKYVEELKSEVEKVTSMTVSSHKLPAGSTPTVTKTVGEDEKVNLDFGLAPGEKGWTIQDARQFYKQLKSLADYLLENHLEDKVYISLFEDNIAHPMREDELENWCGGTGVMLSIDPDGYYYPCIRYMESSLGKDVKPLQIGHCSRGIGQTDKDKEVLHCLDCITRRTQSTDECFYCPIAAGCAWCSAYNYQTFGTPDKRATYICDMHKKHAH